MEKVVVLDGSFKKSLSAEEFFLMLGDSCPFCGSMLQPLNRKRTITGCQEQDCDPKFVAIINCKAMFYIDLNNSSGKIETFDVNVDFPKGITNIKRYMTKDILFVLKRTLNPFDKEDMDNLKLFAKRISQLTIFE